MCTYCSVVSKIGMKLITKAANSVCVVNTWYSGLIYTLAYWTMLYLYSCGSNHTGANVIKHIHILLLQRQRTKRYTRTHSPLLVMSCSTCTYFSFVICFPAIIPTVHFSSDIFILPNSINSDLNFSNARNGLQLQLRGTPHM